MAQRMQQQNWLVGYAQLAGIEQVFRGWPDEPGLYPVWKGLLKIYGRIISCMKLNFCGFFRTCCNMPKLLKVNGWTESYTDSMFDICYSMFVIELPAKK